ncbi:RraA family protein [Allomesorhizobium camelthorni]|uniref:Putative 4-hydroxy-4-methyl-2-oxoglutarate aldolase n=1 Tax=Allomesorhizobium camelthorni TaxID=475069 RepID=A0A6G4WIY2_9HYPH|nr:RraA family protein [Mesorhizobium camelthorni]NGO54080.1 RraA family protein [Mesorhizobium camelthorni]
MPIPGHRSYPSSPTVPQNLLDSFRGVAVAVVSDNMNRLHGTRGLKSFGAGVLVGTAVTVKTRPGDNMTLHKAYEILRPGDVLVVDGGGNVEQALVGEIMMARARAMGVAGFVIDGAIRDVAAFRDGDFPCFARGVTHRGPYKSGPGEINVPVNIDGMVVMPGDIVLGDNDGVVAFPPSIAEELHALVRQQEEREADALKAIREGRFDNSYIGAHGLSKVSSQ